MKNLFHELSSKETQCSGIYMIVCKHHTYVGSSKSMYSRLREHGYRLSAKQHNNDFLQKCYNKYGAENLFYKILEVCLPEERIEKENHYIATLKPDLNLILDNVTKTFSTYSRQKISKAVKKQWENGERKHVKRRIEIYNLKGDYLETVENAEIAAKKLGVSTHTIQCSAKNYYKGTSCNLHRVRYEFSKVPIRKFDYVKPEIVTTKFDYFLKTENGEYPIRLGVRDINKTLADLLLKGVRDCHIIMKPKEKSDQVRFKREELLEHPEKDNQQPSLDSNIFEGSTTNNRVLTDNAEDSNVDTSIPESLKDLL